MKTKTIAAVSSLLIAIVLPNCASVGSSAVADYNGDGIISDAEYKQHQIRNRVQQEEVYTERMKRRNAEDTVHGVNRGIHSVEGILRAGERLF